MSGQAQAQHGRNCRCRECAALFAVVRPAPMMRCDHRDCTAEAPAFANADGWLTDSGYHFCPAHAGGTR